MFKLLIILITVFICWTIVRTEELFGWLLSEIIYEKYFGKEEDSWND